jgi:hypothetical protein
MIDSSWYDTYLIIFEDAPEILGEYCEDKAKELGISAEYFIEEFITK